VRVNQTDDSLAASVANALRLPLKSDDVPRGTCHSEERHETLKPSDIRGRDEESAFD